VINKHNLWTIRKSWSFHFACVALELTT